MNSTDSDRTPTHHLSARVTAGMIISTVPASLLRLQTAEILMWLTIGGSCGGGGGGGAAEDGSFTSAGQASSTTLNGYLSCLVRV